MKITREDVMRVAELAHLELTDAEVELYRGQLDAILEYAEKLNQLDTAAIEPMAGGRPAGIADDPSSAVREDAAWAAAPIEPAEALRTAPDASAVAAGGPGFFRVPKVIDR
jgi:aspartyl-tRNA(Asn)/glutamyl-tRNA(Gln) amidotransferase subunit C